MQQGAKQGARGALSVFEAAIRSRVPRPAAAETALLLAAGGEFAFVILHSAVGEGLLDRQLVQTILVSAPLSMFCIPALASIGAALGRSTNARAKDP